MLNKYQIQAEQSKRSFHKFIKYAWQYIDPNPFTDNWHIGIIADYLTATVPIHPKMTPDIRRLAINLPPRFAKSKILDLFNAWVWACISTQKKFLYASYGEGIAMENAEETRSLIQSNWYKTCFPHVKLSTTQNEKSFYKTIDRGYRISIGVGGKGAGLGGQYVIGDDILNSSDRFSEVKIKGANNWWDGTMGSRLNNPRYDVKILVGQRLHPDDIFSHVKEKEEYQELILPLEYQGKIFVPGVNLPEDPRTEIGELLFPDRVGEKELGELKSSFTKFDFNTQYNQIPSGLSGTFFERDWFPRVDTYSIHSTWLSWDTASTAKNSSAHSAITVSSLTNDGFLVIREVQKFKLEFIQLVEKILEYAEKYRYDKFSALLIESKSSGEEAISTLRQTAPEWLKPHIISINPKGEKENRAKEASLWCEKKCIKLPYPDDSLDWLADFESDLYTYPGGCLDTIDSFDQIVNYLSGELEFGLRTRRKKGVL